MQIITEFQGEYRWLSNFWYCPVRIDGVDFPSSENAYQAMKFPKIMWHRFQHISPAAAKKMAHRLNMNKPYDPEWQKKHLENMEIVTRAKYAQNADLEIRLLQTGDAILQEGNYWNDTFWGVCRGIGQNNLGKLLMKIREELRRSK